MTNLTTIRCRACHSPVEGHSVFIKSQRETVNGHTARTLSGGFGGLLDPRIGCEKTKKVCYYQDTYNLDYANTSIRKYIYMAKIICDAVQCALYIQLNPEDRHGLGLDYTIMST